MKEVQLTRRDASLLYLEMERGGHIKDLNVASLASIDRLADAFEKVIGEYPASKGPEMSAIGENGRPTGEKRASWKLEYPVASFVSVSIESDDWELLCNLWDKIPKVRFASSREARRQVERIENSLRPSGKPPAKPKAKR